MQGTKQMGVQSLSLEDPLGNGNQLQYSCLENPMAGEPGGLQSTGWQRVRPD